MPNLIKIGHVFLNLDRAQSIEDFFATSKEDRIVVVFDGGEGSSQTFTGKEADDLRTWLNSVAINLRAAADRDASS